MNNASYNSGERALSLLLRKILRPESNSSDFCASLRPCSPFYSFLIRFKREDSRELSIEPGSRNEAGSRLTIEFARLGLRS
jgi:hypothetical protein